MNRLIFKDEGDPTPRLAGRSGRDRYPIPEDIEAIGVKDMAALLAGEP